MIPSFNLPVVQFTCLNARVSFSRQVVGFILIWLMFGFQVIGNKYCHFRVDRYLFGLIPSWAG